MNNCPESSTPRRGLAARGHLFKPVNADGQPTACWCTRVTIGGRRVVFSLSPDAPRAASLDQELRTRLRTGAPQAQVEAWLIREREGSGPIVLPGAAAPDVATIGDIIRVHVQLHPGNAGARVLSEYRRTTLRGLETVFRYRAGRPPVGRTGFLFHLERYAPYLELPHTVLDHAFAQDYCAARRQGLAPGSEAERRRIVSINTELKCMHCMFSVDALVAYQGAGLQLCSLSGFLQHPGIPAAQGALPALPEDETIGLHASLPALATTDPLAWLVVVLALLAGLRKQEILYARRDWLSRATGSTINVQHGPGFSPKFGQDRPIGIPDWLLDLLLDLPSGYLLGRGTVWARGRAIRRAQRWLRARGLTRTTKPLHRVRAHFAGYLLRHLANDLNRVRRLLGHESLRTTFRHYSRVPLSVATASLWEVVPANLAEILRRLRAELA